MTDWITDPFTVIDGGLATALESLGHHPAGALWTAQLVIDRPEAVVAAHRSFVEAGADIVVSSSYQASVEGFVRAGLGRPAARLALASTTALARRSEAPFVAASVGPFGAVLADGSEYHGRYAAGWDEVRAFHRARLEVLAATGPDLFAVETIPTAVEAEIVLDELARLDAGPAWLAVTCLDDRSTAGGDEIERVAALANDAASVAAFGVNCTSPRHVGALLRRAGAVSSLPLVAYPNHGRVWDAPAECWVGEETGDVTAHLSAWRALGARLIGGCCGVGAGVVAQLAHARDGSRPQG